MLSYGRSGEPIESFRRAHPSDQRNEWPQTDKTKVYVYRPDSIWFCHTVTHSVSLPNKKISVDFDGVLLHLLLGREWISDDMAQKLLRGRYKGGSPRRGGALQNLWLEYYQRIRKPIPGVAESLKTLKASGYELCLLTSRRAFLRPASENWLRRRSLLNYFTNLLFNDTDKQGTEFKAGIVEALDIGTHIDDSKMVISHLAAKFPRKKFLFFGKRESGNLPKNVTAVPSWPELVDRLKAGNEA